MIDSNEIQKMVSQILHRQRGIPTREAIDPGREWLLGVCATVLLVSLGGGISYGLYLNTISLEVDVNQVPAVVIPYNASFVDQTVIDFRERAEVYRTFQGIADVPTVPVVATSTEAVETATSGTATSTDIADEVEPVTVPTPSESLPPLPRDEEERPDLEV
jgi:hypothetical protein